MRSMKKVKKHYNVNNKHASKFDKPEAQIAYELYCKHLSKGKSKKSFFYESPTLQLTSRSLEKYVKSHKDDFPPLAKIISEAKGFALWEEVCERLARGKGNGKENFRALQMIMSNKFKWDRKEEIEEADLEDLKDRFAAHEKP